MVFGFFKKKDKDQNEGMSSRRRRMISSQRAPVVTKGQKPQRKAAATQGSSKREPVAPAAAPKKDVGTLKRGQSSALTVAGDIEQADLDLKNFIIETELGEAGKVEDAFSRKTDNVPFIQILIDEEIVNQNDLLVELSKKCMIPQGKLEKYRIRKKALECLDAESARKLMILPVDKLGQILSVAMVNPLNTKAIKTLSDLTGLRVKTVVCTYGGFVEQYRTHYGKGGKVEGSEDTIDISVEEPEAISPDEFKKMMSSASDKAKTAAPEKKSVSEKKAATAPPPVPETPAPAVKPEPVQDAEPALEAEAVEEAEEILDAEEVELVFDEPADAAADSSPPPPPPPVPETAALESADTAEEPMDFVEPELEGPQILEPLIEGIDLNADDDDDLTIEPVIISAEDVESDAVLDISFEPGEAAESVDAIQVVEEEFNQGIRLGAVDLFKKWEGMHRKQRIITLKQIPEDIFDFIVS